ncbi:glycosyltransferase family 1 protein [Microbacterium sp. zg.Y909]|uniref:glycosyltransferase family 1 protein n=1 Tax=Microbacterium sp. zg.Y909 TaxID=2969413 RepID=UPI00214B66AB|nr:glycosyltransferase family 1 protein [Microbacterium sp. zg.Y909]MCR2823918.1 glycosyltransferase family 1 protein [Microbacterium sp. zg.Y909]
MGNTSALGRILRTARKAAGKSPREVAQHAVSRLAARVDIAALSFPLLPEDVADSAAPRDAGTPWHPSGASRPRVAWLAFPPGAGSGGHTTMFRMMEACRSAGYDNTLVLYDRYGGDVAGRIDVVRSAWPWLQCDVESLTADLAGFDAVIASSWPTAHVAARRGLTGQPSLYFIQDYEPYFYPRGSEYSLAEDSYRLGLRPIALGQMVGDSLERELGVSSDRIPFGCDRDIYHRIAPPRARRGIVFYAKRHNDRRGYMLAMLALREFHRMNPDEPIHVYGDAPRDLGVPVTAHGNLAPDQLNELYNSVVTGLALSFTNISLVAEEMRLAGVIPIVNDSLLARADLPGPHVGWAPPTPHALAAALTTAIQRARVSDESAAIAESVRTKSWDATGAEFAKLLTQTLADTHAR